MISFLLAIFIAVPQLLMAQATACTATSPANCKVCSGTNGATCTTCNDGYILNGVACVKCTDYCKTCDTGASTADTTCQVCSQSYVLNIATGAKPTCGQTCPKTVVTAPATPADQFSTTEPYTAGGETTR